MNQWEESKKLECRYSGEKLGRPFLDLGVMPLANSYVKPEDKDNEEFRCPLALVRAPESGLVQLSHVVPPDLMFRHYLYVSSTTQTFRDHFAQYAVSVKNRLPEIQDPLAVDIGSNDGLLLDCYRRQGMRSVGIDPAVNLAAEANKKGLTTINDYFGEASVREVIRSHGKAHAISANNVFAHIDGIKDVCRNVLELLDDKGLFVIEFPYLVTMVEELLFDMIYHEHLSYIAVHPLQYLLRQYGLEIFDIERVSSHGGSLRVFVQIEGKGGRAVAAIVKAMMDQEEAKGYLENAVYEKFAADVLAIKDDFCAFIRGLREEGKKIAGYGAPAKASTILNFYNLSCREIDYVVDDNPLKQGYYVPGVKIPIVSGKKLEEDLPDVVIIFAWNFASEILKKIGRLRDKGVRFVLPLPAPQSAGIGKSRFDV